MQSTSVVWPQGIRGVIFSFLDILSLINKISKLSKKQRKYIRSTDVLDQQRNLKIVLDSEREHPINLSELAYCLKLSTSIHLHLHRLENLEMSILSLILTRWKSKLLKNYLVIHMRSQNVINSDTLSKFVKARDLVHINKL